MARQKKNENDDLEGFDESESEVATKEETETKELADAGIVKQEPVVKVKEDIVVKPRRAYVLDKLGKKQKDPDDASKFMEYEPGQQHLHVGYVNENGVLFPVGFKFKGGHVSWRDVVLNRCPKCGHKQSIDEAVQGACQNMKVKPDDVPCGYSIYEELNGYAIKPE